MTLLELAQKLRPYIEKAAMSLSDEDALEAINLFPNWNGDGIAYKKDDKVNYENILYLLYELQVQFLNENLDKLNYYQH